MSFEPDKHVHHASAHASTTGVVDAGLQSHMRTVYNTMCLGLIITGLSAFAVASIEPLYNLIFGTPARYVALFGPLAFLWFGFSPARVSRMSSSAVRTTFTLFSAVFGISLAYIFHVFTDESIARVFFITAGMFAGISLFGYTTKKDLTGVGSFMIMGLFGIIIASVVNIFLQSAMMLFVTSILGVVIFTGLTAWETQRIKESYSASFGTEANSKMAILGALGLYMNFVLLFQNLLHLFGSQE